MRDDKNDWDVERLDSDWERFADKLKNLPQHISALTYDGMSLPVPRARYAAIEFSDRYLLPGPYTWADVEERFTPVSIPELPGIPKAPALHLPTARYSFLYFESRNKGEPSHFEEDLARRRRTLARAEELRAQIEEKRKVFEDIFAKETIKLQELRQRVLAEDPEALVTLIELANKRHWLPAGLRREFKALAEPDAKVVLIELRFPDYSNHKFVVGALKNGKKKYASATENKKILRGTLYSVVTR